MIFPKKLVDRVRHFLGLNMYEAQIWLALLAHGIASAGELADSANVPRSRAYDILESLRKKGLVVLKEEGRPAKYMAVPPAQALENLKKFYEEEAEVNKANLEKLLDAPAFKRLQDIYKKGAQLLELPELVGLVREKANVFRHLHTLIRNANKELRIMAMPEDVKELVENHMDALKAAAARGVKIKLLVPEGTEVGELAKIAEVRYTKAPITRALVKDGNEVVMLFLNPREAHPAFESGVWASSAYLANTFNKLFEEAWKNA